MQACETSSEDLPFHEYRRLLSGTLRHTGAGDGMCHHSSALYSGELRLVHKAWSFPPSAKALNTAERLCRGGGLAISVLEVLLSGWVCFCRFFIMPLVL